MYLGWRVNTAAKKGANHPKWKDAYCENIWPVRWPVGQKE